MRTECAALGMVERRDHHIPINYGALFPRYTFAISRRDTPEVCHLFRPREGVGNAGCPVHPQPRVRKWWLECTRVFTARSPESPGIPARNGLRLITCSPRRSGFLVTVAPRMWNRPRPVGPTIPPRDLTPASRRQDHTTSPSAAAPFVCAPGDRSRETRPAIPFRADAAASTASRRNVRDDRETPLCEAGRGTI
jgi:hypothetical protein